MARLCHYLIGMGTTLGRMMVQDPTHETGVRVLSGPENGKEVIRARERKSNAALQLKMAGSEWEEIAQVCGYPTERAAQIAVEQALERELKAQPNQSKLRTLASKRLEQLLRAGWAKAIDPDHPEQAVMIERSRMVVADWRKLHGLDAPTQMVVHSPTADEIEKWVAAVVATQPGAVTLEEADIFDAEIIDEPKEIEA